MTVTAMQYDRVEITWPTPVSGSAQVTITAPDSTTETLAATFGLLEVAGYTATFLALQVGTYQVAWTGPSGSRNDTVVVTAFVLDRIITLQQCYLTLGYDDATIDAAVGQFPARDADMLTYADAATGVIESIVGPIRRQAITETFDGGVDVLKLKARPTEILQVTSSGVPLYTWVPDYRSGLLWAGLGLGFVWGMQNVRVVYMAGAEHPTPTQLLAIREQFRFMWQQGRQGQHAALDEQYTSAPALPMGFAVPNRVYELLARESVLPGFA